MQGVLVFANAAARTSAITSPQQGQVSFLKDTNSTEYYTGSAWVAIGGSSSPLTTKGDVYGYSTTNARIPVGANDTVLTADSTQALGVKWAAPAGGGKILQVIQATTGTTTNVNSTSYTNITNVTASITPSATTSRIMVMISVPYAVGNTSGVDCGIGVKILRGSTNILEDDNCGGLTIAGLGNNNQGLGNVLTLTYIDSPSSTSSTTYQLQGKRHRGNYCTFNAYEFTAATASVILMEIGA
jgi:hypothetical protein